MKKVLYGTTALIAAGAFAATANAQSIELSIGGKQEMFFLAGDSNDNALETWASTGMYSDTELYFTGQTTLDNGITVQALIQLEAEDRMDSNADEQAIILSGGFGAMQIGQRQTHVGMMQYMAPAVGGPFWANEVHDWNWPNFAVSHGGAYNNYYTDDDLSVSYVTPSFFGFTLAGAYAPDSSDNDDSVYEEWNTTGSDYKDLLQVGAAFDNEFSGVGIHADVTYQYFFGAGPVTTTTSTTTVNFPVVDVAPADGAADTTTVTTTTKTTNPDRSLLRGGLSVSYMGFEVGGSYGHWYYDGARNDLDSWAAGASYSNGPYAVAFEYQGSWNDANNVSANTYTFTGRYILGPGINLGAAIYHGDEDIPGGGNDRESTGVVMGIGLSF